MRKEEEITLFVIALLIVLTAFSFILSIGGVYEPFVAAVFLDGVVISFIGCYKITHIVYRKLTEWYLIYKQRSRW